MTLRRRIGPAIERLGDSPRFPFWLAVLSMALVAPALFVGWNLDDYLHRYCGLGMAGSEEICPSYLSFFTIIPGKPELTHRLIEDGFSPWWTDESLLVAFLRPVTALTHRLDYLLFPDSAFMMHVHSLLWFGGAVCVATVLYRSVMGMGAASTAAALMFAVDHVHGMPAGWIANRNALVGSFFGTAALVFYTRGRRSGTNHSAFAGVTCLLLGLLGGEIALGAWGYLLAHALVLDERSAWERARGLSPYLVATIAWRLVYQALGFGASGSGLYIDPAHEPLAFLRAIPARFPPLLLGTFGIPPAEAMFFVTRHLATLAMAGGFLFAVFAAVAIWPLARVDRITRFFALGAVFALVPTCTAVPNNRLLYFPSIGAMGVITGLIGAFRAGDARLPGGLRRSVSRLFTLLTGGLHALVSPVLLPLAALNIYLTHSITDVAIPSANAELTDPPRQELILVSAPEYYSGTLPRLMRRLAHQPEPAHQRLLSVGPVAIDARRIGAHRLELSYENGLLAPVLTRLYRGPRSPLRAGDRVMLEGLTIDVIEVTSDGRPRVVVYTFGKELSSPDLKWVIWQKDRFVRFTPPARDGEVVHVEPARSSFEIGSS